MPTNIIDSTLEQGKNINLFIMFFKGPCIIKIRKQYVSLAVQMVSFLKVCRSYYSSKHNVTKPIKKIKTIQYKKKIQGTNTELCKKIIDMLAFLAAQHSSTVPYTCMAILFCKQKHKRKEIIL